MEQVIYADILFIVNFSMDFLALYITSRILHARCHFAALVLGSGIGAVYGIISLVASGNATLNTAINTAIAMLMCYIVYGAPSAIILIRNTLCFYGISFLMGGVMTGVFNLANRGLNGRGIVINGDTATLYSEISPGTFMLVALISVLISYVCSAILKKCRDVKRSHLYIRIKDKEVECNGITDTGNLLCDPVSALPCVICTLRIFEALLPKSVISVFRDKNIGILEYTDPEFAKKIRIIPMHSVGGSGIIVGIIPDEIKIDGQYKQICLACDPSAKCFAETESVIPASVI